MIDIDSSGTDTSSEDDINTRDDETGLSINEEYSSENSEYDETSGSDESREHSEFPEASDGEEEQEEYSSDDDAGISSTATIELLPITKVVIPVYQRNTYFNQVKNEIATYLNIVAIPGIPSNALWRGLNIFGIPRPISTYRKTLLEYVGAETAATSITVGPAIFLTVAVIDALRTMKQYPAPATTTEAVSSYCQRWSGHWHRAFEAYCKDKIYIDSLLLGFKFVMGALGWTAGYSFFEESSPFMQPLGAGAGNAIGLFLACLLANLINHSLGKNINEGEYWFISTSKVAFAALSEGIAWAVTSNINIYHNIMEQVSYNTYGINMIKASAALFDALTVGLCSSFAFSFTPLISVGIERFIRYIFCGSTQQPLPAADSLNINHDMTRTKPRPSRCCLSFFSRADEERQEDVSETSRLLPRENSLHNMLSATNHAPGESDDDIESYEFDDTARSAEEHEYESSWCRGDLPCSLL